MIGEILKQLTDLIKPISEIRKDRRELADNALRAISHALDETSLYYRSIDGGSERNGEVEAQLVKYWAAAAIPLRHIAPDLAMVCEYKAEYWLNPDSWSDWKVRSKGIALDNVRAKYRALLGPKLPVTLRPFAPIRRP